MSETSRDYDVLRVADLDPTPTDISVKYVRTFEITGLDDLKDGRVRIRLPDREAYLEAPPFFGRGDGPRLGDRLIVYADGYVSWCPRATYLRDYHRPGADDIEQRCLTEVSAIGAHFDADRSAFAVAVTNLETGFLWLDKALSPRRNKE